MARRRCPAITSLGNASDSKLIESVLAGDVQAFSTIVERYKRKVFAVAFAILGSTHDAEDVAQETFTVAYYSLHSLDNTDRLGSWLCGIAHHRACKWLKHRYSKKEISLCDSMVIAIADNDPTSHLSDMITACDMRHEVYVAINSLPPAQRETVVLYYVSGYTQKEVAQILGVPLGTVKRRLFAARHKLKEGLWHMVADRLSKEQPAEDFAARVQAALAEAYKAKGKGFREDAATHCDAALDLIKRMTDSPETKELRAKVLSLKASALWFPSSNREELLGYLEEALALREQVGNQEVLVSHMRELAVRYSNSRKLDKAYALLERTCVLCKEIGDASGQGECLIWLGHADMRTELTKAHERFIEALPLLDSEKSRSMHIVCQTALRVIDSALVANRKLSELIIYVADCEVLQTTDDGIRYAGQPGFSGSHIDTDEQKSLSVSLLHSISQLGALWDMRWQLDYAWDGQAFSYTYLPLQFQAKVSNDAALVETPAGRFERCIQIEWSTRPSDNDTGEERQQRLNKLNCGDKTVWYAPGVGPVRLVLQRANGTYHDMQLAEYHLTTPDSYQFPIAIGNRWSYRVVNVPDTYIQEIVFEVLAQEGDRYFLAHHEVVYKNE